MDTTKPVLRRKFMALMANIRKDKRLQINKLSSYLKNLEKEGQNKLGSRRRNVILHIGVEITSIRSKPKIETNGTNSLCFEREVRLKKLCYD